MRMNTLNNYDLLARTKTLVAEERRTTLALIDCLEEVQRRRLYTELGYASLWEFATKYLGLSEGSAQRRILAMRLVREEPSAKEALASGELTFTNAAKIQAFAQKQEKEGQSIDTKEVIDQVKNKTQQECERLLMEKAPEKLPDDRKRTVSSKGDQELKFVVSAETFSQLEELKGLLAHSKPRATYAELLQYLLNEMLPRLKRKKGISKSTATVAASKTKDVTTPRTDVTSETPRTHLVPPTLRNYTPAATPRVYIPATIRKSIWHRSQGRCEFTASTGRRCESRFQLELDHKHPLALGGSHQIENLRILCREHNTQQARVRLGTQNAKEPGKTRLDQIRIEATPFQG